MASIGAQVASGLAALHATGQLHGDVKPANLLRVGPDWKLGDFGVTVAVQGSYAVAPGATLDYPPPELSTESDGFRVHRSSDVWALGITLWMAATGRHPFVGAAPYTRLAAALRGDRAPAEIEPRLAELIDRFCLVHDPRARAEAAELADRLYRLVGQLSRPEPGPPWAGPPGPGRVGPQPGPAPFAAAPAPIAPVPPAHSQAPVREAAPTRQSTSPARLLATAAAAVATTAAVVALTSLAAAAVPVGLGAPSRLPGADARRAGRHRPAAAPARSAWSPVAGGGRRGPDRTRRHRLPVRGG